MRNLCTYLTNFEKNKLSQTCKQIRWSCLELKLVTYSLTRDVSLKFYRSFLAENNVMINEKESKVYSKICQQQVKGVRVISVDLSNTNYKSIDLKKFGQDLEILNLSHSKFLAKLFNIGDKLKNIDLTYCNRFYDISEFTNVKKLTICRNEGSYWNRALNDFSSLINLHELSINGSLISNYELHYFKNIHTLTLIECYWISDVSDLSNIHTLKLVNCDNIVDVSPLSNLTNLTIIRCRRITNVSMLSNVKNLIITSCRNINNWGLITPTY